MKVTINPTELEKVEKLLKFVGDNAPKVLCRAVNATLMNCRTQSTKKIGEHLNLKASVIKLYFWMKKANLSSFSAELQISGERLPLYKSSGPNYGAKQTSTGVVFQVRKDKGKELFKHAFLATMSSGHTGVFMRVTRKSRAIRQVYGPSIPKSFEKSGNLSDVLTFSSDRLIENTRQQVNRVLALQEVETISAEDLENL